MNSSFGHKAASAFRPGRTTIAGGLRVFAAGMLAVLSIQAREWRVGVVQGTIGGRYSSFQIDRYGNSHVCSFSPANAVLSYSFWDHSLNKWFTSVLDRSSGFCSLALDSQQRPHISYIAYGTDKLKYARWNGTFWDKQEINIATAKIISYNTSIALDSEDRPNISCYEEPLRLRVVRWNGKFWESRTADYDQGSGKFNSIAIDSLDRPEIAYCNVEYKNASLRFVRWNGASWDHEYIEGQEGSIETYSVAMILDKADVPHIAYTDVNKRLIKYAVKRDGKWNTQVVGAVAMVGYPDRNGIALDEHGNVYISFYDAGTGELKLAYRIGKHWFNEVVDHQSGVTNTLRIAGDSIWLTYADDSGEQLRYALTTLPQSSGDATAGSRGEVFNERIER